MKTILFFLSLFLITSCDKQDQPKQEKHNEFYGSWYLVEIYSWPNFYQYTNEIKWTFDNNNIDILIENGTNVPNDCSFENGTYSYNLHNIDNNNYINITCNNNISRNYRYEITNDTLFLYLGELVTDGVRITLIKTN